MMKSPLDKIQLTPGQALPPGFPGPFIFADSLSSVETLLTNIQGLLKVALDNARIQEKQIQQEKKELRMELYREREIRENLERQLAVELQSRSKFNKFSITEKVNIVLEIFSVVIKIFSDITWDCEKGAIIIKSNPIPIIPKKFSQ
ncbi:hypothetical protein Celaphus_00009809 [Cervus elaphus hippelaphus]|uniref:Uncharacterized protein n=1 Tax=Cervus elaphus hippelaphus TaxID=46360 RepID=A0A212C0C4_CEREH|nr:hypothetical protein Celaphus_00009809 [Cervus elaphus hippelaphus]